MTQAFLICKREATVQEQKPFTTRGLLQPPFNKTGDEAMKKQTAGNNAFLKAVKKLWNTPIFKKASLLVNTEGEDAARAYVQTFTTKPLDY